MTFSRLSREWRGVPVCAFVSAQKRNRESEGVKSNLQDAVFASSGARDRAVRRPSSHTLIDILWFGCQPSAVAARSSTLPTATPTTGATGLRLQSVNLPPVFNCQTQMRDHCRGFHAPRKLGIRGKKDTHLRTVIAGLLTARTDSAPQRLNLRHRRRCAWLTSSDVFWRSLQGAHLP
jgi:hypothetical protein